MIIPLPPEFETKRGRGRKELEVKTAVRKWYSTAWLRIGNVGFHLEPQN